MMRPGWPEDGTPSVENLRDLRLRALLNDLVHDLGPVKAAADLGIDRKTLWRSEGAGQMSPRLVEALERMLLERAVAAMDEDRRRVGVLEERVGEMEGQLAAALAEVNGTGNAGAVEKRGDGGAAAGVLPGASAAGAAAVEAGRRKRHG